MIGAAEIDEMMAEYAEIGATQGRDVGAVRWPPTLDGSDEPVRSGQAVQPAPRRTGAEVVS